MRWGSRGEPVKHLQGGLNFAGKSRFPDLETDGAFGAKTHARVLEFQGQKGLSKDGIVGNQTNGALDQFIKAFLEHIKTIAIPADEQAARDRIVQIARRMYQLHGWRTQDERGKDRNRIAVNYRTDKESNERQGGAIMAQIAALTGNAAISPGKCLTLTEKEENFYTTGKVPPTDIGKWCGAFVFAVYKLAGLNIGFWPMVSTAAPKQDKKTLFDTVNKQGVVRPGDYGVTNWGYMLNGKWHHGENHHFLVVETRGNQLVTIEGNASFRVNPQFAPLTIVRREDRYISTIMNDPQKDSGFGRPIWKEVLKKSPTGASG